jgi:hypothetical protein
MMSSRRLGSFLALASTALVICAVGALIAALIGNDPERTAPDSVQWVALVITLVVGLIGGLMVRPYPVDNLLPALWMVTIGLGVYIVHATVGRNPQLSLMSAGAAVLGYAAMAIRRRGDPFGRASQMNLTLAEMRRRFEARGLLLSGDEVHELRSQDTGFRCGICKSTEHRPDKDWLDGFMRCPHDASHVFHAKHFMTLNWRCPKDHKGLLIETNTDGE